MKTILKAIEKKGLAQFLIPSRDGSPMVKDESGYWIIFRSNVVNEYAGPDSHMIHGYDVKDALEQINFCRIVG